MDIVKQKNLAASVAAIGLSALFLLNRYSVEGLCILGIWTLYLLLRTVIGAGKNRYGISDFLGEYVGGTLIALLLIYYCQSFSLMDTIENRMMDEDTFIAIPLLLACFLVTRWLLKKKLVFQILAYVITFIFYYSILQSSASLPGDMQLTYVLMPVACVILLFALMQNIQNKYAGKVSNTAFGFLHLLLAVAVLLFTFNREFLNQMVMLLRFTMGMPSWPVPSVLITTLLFVIAAFVTYRCDKKQNSPLYDTSVVIAVLIHVLAVPFCLANQSEFLPVFVVLLLALDMVVFFRKEKTAEKALGSKWKVRENDLYLVGGSLLLACLYLSFLANALDIMLVIVLSIILLIYLARSGKGTGGTAFWVVLIAVYGLFTAMVCGHNAVMPGEFARELLCIICLCVPFIFGIYIVSVPNREKPLPERGVKLFLSILCIILLFMVMIH